ncbi:carbohydrate sulfotransferase 1-like [Glandiceps talaboti]
MKKFRWKAVLSTLLVLTICTAVTYHRNYSESNKQFRNIDICDIEGVPLTKDDDSHVKVLVFARKRTGSKLTARYVATHPDFFYVYEPGYMVADYFDKMKGRDTNEYLKTVEPQLLTFLEAIYSCNFTGHEYFIWYLNNMDMFRKRGLYNLTLPITMDSITDFCKSKSHIVVKVIRMYSLNMAEPLLKKHNIKIINLVRDPRGMARSREIFRKSVNRKLGYEGAVMSNVLQNEIKDVCEWMDMNFKFALNGPIWHKENYLLVRYEDIADKPEQTVSKMYRFLSLSLPPNIGDVINERVEFLTKNGQAWRGEAQFEDVILIQELCSMETMEMFGYHPVNSLRELRERDSLISNDFSPFDDSPTL